MNHTDERSQSVANLHVRAMQPLIAPLELKNRMPLTAEATRTVTGAREAIRNVLRGEDRRLVIVIGPCSIHDPEAALDYARRLAQLQQNLSNQLLILMRVYLEKPRTTIGWRGLINDPQLNGSFDMGEGLRIARDLLLEINTMGLPVATEMLDPISPQYLDDQISLATIGARTTEAQTHRALASGISMPVGFKNGTDGGIQVAVNACVAAAGQHSFLGITEEGQSAVVKTTGNPDSFVILRGGRHGPNYQEEHVVQATRLMREANLQPAVMIDCSHANAENDFRRQETVWYKVIEQIVAQPTPIIGLMVESNIAEGKQPLLADRSALRYGVSLTDGCISWETTERLLVETHHALEMRQR
ncbi:3-deoxy-7-phosphoheptulonate synthase [Candidatus Viridilinea mediisalina]|uniref:Phospho-2-dehydro-3-deoxyheptonate aldolase n=1 Tax=Candidatus Viridilinea mediisalina TaxID=2024553 RepID=A0A2A6RKC0_9CHLR|nr:3-deoxy-7-phosphoheptulonate synthase [Candidatus Viridilinea mediisalina]PDW03564.1 3-deoxy-7-phosphoheptulonate synthase [Candidatus Viridilinea mediisalina]